MAATHSLDLESSSSQYASIADASCPNLEITSAKTWECWFKPESIGTMVLMGKVAGASGVQIFFTTTYIQFYHNGTATNSTVSMSSPPTAGVWQHVAGVYDTSTLKIYINGELINSVAATGSSSDGNGVFYLGRNDAGSYYDGLIRNARVWSVARTQQEIRDNMNVDIPVGTGLQGNWILNNSYTDSSANGYTLTASGSPVFSTTYPDAIDLVENKTFTKKHKITVQHTQVAGSANLTDVPIVFTESNFLSDIFTNSQGSEINTNFLKNDSNLKAYYRMESGALTTDSSGNGYTLTNNNTVGETTGKFGGAADFGNSNTNKSLSISNNLGILGTAITLSCWVKLNTEVASGSYHFVSQQNNTTDIWFHLSYEFNSGTRRLAFKRTRNGVANDEFFYTITLGTSNWYHLILTYDGATVRGYLNGVLIGSVASTGNGSGTTLDSFDIGRYNNGSYASALIDDVAVFNRALSAEEVRSLYAGGQDLRFSSDIDGKTRLAHEIVSFDKGTSKAEVWVKANTLDYDDNTDIYVHYGNATASAIDENEAFGKHQVYPSAYKAVWHMGNATDSTSSSNDGTATSVTFNTTNGKIVDGGGFDGSTSGIGLGNVSPLNLSTLSVCGWVKTSNTSLQIIYSNRFDGNSGFTLNMINKFYMTTENTGAVVKQLESTSNYADGNWHFVCGVKGSNTSNGSFLYVDGSLVATGTLDNPANSEKSIGYRNQAGTRQFYFNGSIDNLFITNNTLSADYISTIYNNQNSPSTFAIASSLAGGSFLLNFV